MTKTTKTHILAIAILAGLGLGAPVASVLANAPAPKHQVADRSPASEVEIAKPAAEITLPEVVITAAAPRKVRPVAMRQAQAEPVRCFSQELEQGGRPGAKTVSVCVPAS